MRLLVAETADAAWQAAARLFGPSGDASEQDGRGGPTLELLHVALTINNPRERWTLSRTPAMNPAFALVEAFWILAGRSDASLVAHWNPRLASFCGSESEYSGAYGYRLRSHFGVDQLDRAYHALRANPDTRQLVLGIWDPAKDLPSADGSPARADVPCNVMSLPKVRNGRLEWLQVLRSNDLFLGLPYNLVQFTTLQEVLAGWLGAELGAYNQMSDSLHVYVSDLLAIRNSDIVEPAPNVDSFALDRASWSQMFPGVIRRLEELSQARTTKAKLQSIALLGDAPVAYENAVRVAAADSARRRHWDDAIDVCIEGVTNPILVQLWERWRARVDRRTAARVS